MMKPVSRASSVALLAAAVLAVPSAASAQTLGLSVGATFATLEGDDAIELDSKTGLMAGAHLAFPLGDIISVVPGAYYVQKGAADGDDYSLTLSYIEIPLLLSVDVLEADRPFGVNLFAGPEFAFRVGCSEEALGESGDCADEDDISSTDFGMIAGGGVSFGRFFVNGGLDIGLKSLDDSEEDNDVKNSMWFLTGGIAIPLGG